HIGAAADAHDLRVDRVGGDLQELKLALPLRLALHGDVDAEHDDVLIAAQHAGLVGQHDHVVERANRGFNNIAVYVGSHGLQNLGRVTHEHRQARGGTARTPKPLRPGNVPRYR